MHSRVKTNGMTPLHYAAFNSQTTRDLVALLIDKGADVEARTQEGWTPLHLAATVRAWGGVEKRRGTCGMASIWDHI